MSPATALLSMTAPQASATSKGSAAAGASDFGDILAALPDDGTAGTATSAPAPAPGRRDGILTEASEASATPNEDGAADDVVVTAPPSVVAPMTSTPLPVDKTPLDRTSADKTGDTGPLVRPAIKPDAEGDAQVQPPAPADVEAKPLQPETLPPLPLAPRLQGRTTGRDGAESVDDASIALATDSGSTLTTVTPAPLTRPPAPVEPVTRKDLSGPVVLPPAPPTAAVIAPDNDGADVATGSASGSQSDPDGATPSTVLAGTVPDPARVGAEATLRPLADRASRSLETNAATGDGISRSDPTAGKAASALPASPSASLSTTTAETSPATVAVEGPLKAESAMGDTTRDAPVEGAAPETAPATQTAQAARDALSPTMSRAAVEATAQIAAQILKRLDGRSTRFEMSLMPDELGRVDVKLDIDSEGRLAARLAFDNPAAATDLKGRADELRRQLEQQGFHLADDAFEFSQRDSGSSAFDRGQDSRQGHARAFAAANRLNTDADIAVQPSRWTALSLTPAGVDMKV